MNTRRGPSLVISAVRSAILALRQLPVALVGLVRLALVNAYRSRRRTKIAALFSACLLAVGYRWMFFDPVGNANASVKDLQTAGSNLRNELHTLDRRFDWPWLTGASNNEPQGGIDSLPSLSLIEDRACKPLRTFTDEAPQIVSALADVEKKATKAAARSRALAAAYETTAARTVEDDGLRTAYLKLAAAWRRDADQLAQAALQARDHRTRFMELRDDARRLLEFFEHANHQPAGRRLMAGDVPDAVRLLLACCLSVREILNDDPLSAFQTGVYQ